MQRSRDSLRLICRVFQAARPGVPSSCQLSSQLVGQQPQAQPLLSLLQQHLLRSLHSASGPRVAAGATRLWAGHARRQLAAGPWSAAPRRCLHQQQPQRTQQQRLRWDPLWLRRGLATEAEVAVKGRPAPRSKALEGKRSLWSGLLLLAPCVLAAFLGKWQLERRNWKLDLLHRREIMLTGEPLDLFVAEEFPVEYTRVQVSGVFDHAKSVFVGPRARSVMGKAEKGYLLITPLYNPDLGRTVLVNRGWVPASWKDSQQERAKGQPAGKVTVEGVLRLGEQPGEFVPENVPSKGEWYYVNTQQLAVECGLPPDTPFVEVLAGEKPVYRELSATELLGGKRQMTPKPADEFPLAKYVEDFMQFSVMPRDHLNYAATWFSLSGLSTLMAIKAIRQGLRK